MALPSVKTHKIILATYAREVLYCVPNDWEVEDINIRDGILYLEGGEQDVPKFELDPERIPEKIEHADWNPYDEIDVWFDCEDEEEELICKMGGEMTNVLRRGVPPEKDCRGVPHQKDDWPCVPCYLMRFADK